MSTPSIFNSDCTDTESKKKKKKEPRCYFFVPDEIFLEILKRLPPRSVLRFRTVCKSWYRLTSEKSFLRAHHHHHTSLAPTSIIIQRWLDPFSKPYDLYISIHGDGDGDEYRNVGIGIRKVERSQIGYEGGGPILDLVASCDGLLLFCPYQKNPKACYYVCNPLTNKWLRTTAWSGHDCRYLCGFYFHQSTGEYRLLRCFYREPSFSQQFYPRILFFEVLTLGESTWRAVKRPFPIHHPIIVAYKLMFGENLGCCRANHISLHGKLYWVAWNDGFGVGRDPWMLVFDVDSEEHWQIPIPKKLQEYDIRDHNCKLIEMNERLGLWQSNPEGEIDVWILKDPLKGEWYRQYTISKEDVITWPSKDVMPMLIRKGKEFLLRYHNGDEFGLILYNIKLKSSRFFEIDRLQYYGRNIHVLYSESLLFYETFQRGSISSPIAAIL